MKMGLSWWLRIHLPMQGTRVPSLIWELRSHMWECKLVKPLRKTRGSHVVFLELRRDSRVTTGISGFLLCWAREVQSSIRVASESWGLRSSHCRAKADFHIIIWVKNTKCFFSTILTFLSKEDTLHGNSFTQT